ncbi:Pycsar system effector family protein [Algoriphagus namhaensis]
MSEPEEEIHKEPQFDAGLDPVDNYWYLINYLRDLIKASEIKAGLVLSFYGLLFNFFFQFSDALFTTAADDAIVYLFMIFWFVFSVVSIYYSFRCFMPQIEDKFDRSVFFFGDILHGYGNIKEYVRELERVSTKSRPLYDQLGEQVFVNAKITAAKFKNVNLSIKYLSFNIGLLFIFILYYAIQAFIKS